jgi:plasmid rolling circle replication initiator protein Rep
MSKPSLSKSGGKGKRHESPVDTSPDGLAAVSPRHDVWNGVKTTAVQIEGIYRAAPAQEFKRYSERVSTCGETLALLQTMNNLDGEISYKAQAHSCKVRHCPMCQRAKAHRFRKRFETALEIITEKYPQGRWIFATFTIKNPPIIDLKTALNEMNEAWKRMLKLVDFPKALGWIRATEVTMGDEGAAMCHPHFHALILVPPSYFSCNYVKHEKWVELWKNALRVDYSPSVKIIAIKDMQGGINREVIKVAGYSVKAETIAAHPEWYLEYTRQTHHLRFHSTGGLVKKYMPKEKPEKNLAEDVADGEAATEEITETGQRVLFGYKRDVKKYKRKPPNPFFQ